MTEEKRFRSRTGGQKGVKLAAFSLIPTLPLKLLAEHYGRGIEKYPSEDGIDNWRKGLPFSLSYSALQRHLNAFWSGEDVDPENGALHLVAAAWHCFTLIYYLSDAKLRKEFDDRQDRMPRDRQDLTQESKTLPPIGPIGRTISY